MLLRPFIFLCALLLLAGCAPSVSPLYRDYEVDAPLAAADVEGEVLESAASNSDVMTRLRAALADAGWDEAGSSSPNVLTTEERKLNDWGLYRVLVSLDAIPIGERHVRVQFHPVRRYITGGRSKIPYLGSGLRRALLPDLNEALETHGFYPLGTPRERDEDQVEGT